MCCGRRIGGSACGTASRNPGPGCGTDSRDIPCGCSSPPATRRARGSESAFGGTAVTSRVTALATPLGDVSASLQCSLTTPVPEWGGQPVRMAQEGRPRRRRRESPLGAQAPGPRVPREIGRPSTGSVTARVTALTTKLGNLSGFLAVLAAVLTELTLLGEHAVTGGMRTLRWSHSDLQRAF